MGIQCHAPAALPPAKGPAPIVQEAGRAPGPVWTVAENIAHTGIRPPEDLPARSEPLYRLSYPGPFTQLFCIKISKNYMFRLLRDRQQWVWRSGVYVSDINPLNAELNPICYLLALLAHHFLHVSRISVKSLTLRLLMSYIYGAPILDVSGSHTTTQHSR